MRENLFRGKRKDNGEWIYGFYAFKHDGNRHFIIKETIADLGPSYFTDYEVFAESVGQNTGLQDKNGQEIYGGDILHWNRGFDMYSAVEYQDGSYWSGETLLADSLEEVVVGNIYDNADLIAEV